MKETLKKLIYGGMDAATRGRGILRNIGGERIRFPARWSRYYTFGYEPETFRFLRATLPKGGVYLDCGGHIGLFAVVAARRVGRAGRVYTFEPTPFSRQVIEQVVAMNRCGHIVSVRPEAISDSQGEATFFDTGEAISNANSLVTTGLDRAGRATTGFKVKTITLDSFCEQNGLQRVDAVKIDVEGAELHALRGATETIKKYKPALSLGLHPPSFDAPAQTLAEIWSLLQECGLRVQHEGRGVDEAWFTSQTSLFDVRCSPQAP